MSEFILPNDDQRLRARERPDRLRVMYQRWEQLLFLHWAWDAEDIQRRLPKGLYVDTFQGKAWMGVVPFYMRDVRPRFLPAVPQISNFLEVNLRTYVHDAQGRPGVWFFSLDCNQLLAIAIARAFFHLPYYPARMQSTLSAEGDVTYASQRRGDVVTSAFDYTLSSAVAPAEFGTLEFFLVERYLLFAKAPGGLRIGQIHHTPYPVAQATVRKWDDRLFALNDFEKPGRAPDHVIGSPQVSVMFFPLERV